MKFKKLIPWITAGWLLCTQTAFAQHGSSMSDPILMEHGQQILTDQSPVGTATWYSWQATNENASILLKAKRQEGKIKLFSTEVFVYHADGSLGFYGGDTLNPDSTMNVYLRSLSNDDRVYVKVNGLNAGGSLMTGTVFTLATLTATTTGCTATSCQLAIDGSMENYIAPCSTLSATIDYYSFKSSCWSLPLASGLNAIGQPYAGTPDIFNACAPGPSGPYTITSVNSTNNGLTAGVCTTAPHTGNGYMGVYVYGDNTHFTGTSLNYREYFCQQMSAAMIPGKTYTLSMWVRLSCKSKFAIKELQMFFSNGQPTQNGLTQMLSPGTVVNFGNGALTNTSSWVQLTTTFVAPAAYTWVSIGNFNTNANTTVTDFDPSNSWVYDMIPGYHRKSSYYFIDDVSIVPSSNSLNITSTGNMLCNGENTTLTASGGTTYTWSPATGLSATTGATVVASPSVNTTYTVTSNYAGCVATQQITIEVTNCCVNPKTGSIILKNANLLAYGTGGALPWSSLTSGPVYSGNIAIPPSGVISGNYTIRGSMTINTPVTFDNTDVAVSEGIYIAQNQPITINHSWWHACDKMWGGISSRNYITVSNSILEDANNAVGVVFFANHPGVNIDNTVFNKNNYGVGMGFASINTSSPSNFRITGTIFTCKDLPASTYTFPLTGNFISMLVDPSGYIYGTQSITKGSTILGLNATRSTSGIFTAGVAATVGTYLNIGNTAATNPPNSVTNYFDYLSAGIINQSAKLQVVNAVFQEHYYDGLSQYYGGIYNNDGHGSYTITNVGNAGSPLKKCIFRNGDVGITARQGGWLNVGTSDFSNLNFDGIEFMQWYSPLSSGSPTCTVDVTYNNFSSCGTDVWGYDNSSIVATIENNTGTGYLSKSTYHIIAQEISLSGNAIYKINNNALTGKGSGIYTGTLTNATVTGNSIDLAYNYMPWYTGGIWNENSTNCLFGNNTISSSMGSNSQKWNVFGIFTSMSTGNTYCSNTITGAGTCMKFQGYCVPSNVFSNSLNNNPSDPALIGLFLDANGNTGSIGVASGPNWYASENIFGNFNYYDSYCQNSSNTVVGKIYYYVGGSYGPVYFPPSNFMANGSIVMNPVYTSVIPGGPLCPTANARMQYTDENTDYSAILFPGDVDNIDHYISCKETYELANDCSDFASAMPDGFMATCESSNIGTFYTASQRASEYAVSRDASVLDNARELNMGISPANIAEANQKRFNVIYYSYLAGDTTSVIDSLESLRYLAKKCPYTDGNAVYQARTLLRAFDRESYSNDCEYNPVNTERKDSFTPQADVVAAETQLYPNPASEKVTVLCGADKAQVIVYDVTGAQVARYNVSKGENALDVSHLDAGSYLFKVLVDQQPVKMEKILIAH